MRRLLSLVLVLAVLNSCTRWSSSHVPLDQALSPEAAPQLARVWLMDGRSIELRRPIVNASTVSGVSTDIRAEMVVIPRDSVRALDVRTTDGAASGLAFIVVIGGVLALISSSMCFINCD